MTSWSRTREAESPIPHSCCHIGPAHKRDVTVRQAEALIICTCMHPTVVPRPPGRGSHMHAFSGPTTDRSCVLEQI